MVKPNKLPLQDQKLQQKNKTTDSPDTQSAPQSPPVGTNAKNQYR